MAGHPPSILVGDGSQSQSGESLYQLDEQLTPVGQVSAATAAASLASFDITYLFVVIGLSINNGSCPKSLPSGSRGVGRSFANGFQ